MRAASLAILLLTAMIGTAAADEVLHYTLPSTYALAVDETTLVCSGGLPMKDLDTLRLYAWPVAGGGARVMRRIYVGGREGESDTFMVPNGYAYWATTTAAGSSESCVSDIVYKVAGVSGVEDPTPGSSVIKVELFDVQGRLVDGAPRASGVYYRRTTYSDGSARKKLVVFLK
jgi:hypothetical protein